MFNKLMFYVSDNIDPIKLIMKTFVMSVFPTIISGNFIIMFPMFINYLIDSVDFVVKYFVGNNVKFKRYEDEYIERYLHLACNVDGIKYTKKCEPQFIINMNIADEIAVLPWPNTISPLWEETPDDKHVGYLENHSIKVVVSRDMIHFYGNIKLINSIIEKCHKLDKDNVPPGYEYIYCTNPTNYRSSNVKKYMNIVGMFNKETVPNNIYDSINNKITNFLADEKMYAKLQLPWKTGFVFKGPVGTGKTLIAMDLARHFKLKLYKFESIDVFLKDYINIPKKSVILFDDVDMLLDYNREMNDKITDFENPKYTKEINDRKIKLKSLMSIFDGYDALYGCILIFITNYIDRIDPALIRPGRLDYHIQFGNLPFETIVTTLKKYYGPNINIPKELSNIQITISQLMANYIIPNLKDYESCRNNLLLLI